MDNYYLKIINNLSTILYLSDVPIFFNKNEFKGKYKEEKDIFDFNIIIAGAIATGSLAFSFLEYALTRKKQQKTKNY